MASEWWYSEGCSGWILVVSKLHKGYVMQRALLKSYFKIFKYFFFFLIFLCKYRLPFMDTPLFANYKYICISALRAVETIRLLWAFTAVSASVWFHYIIWRLTICRPVGLALLWVWDWFRLGNWWSALGGADGMRWRWGWAWVTIPPCTSRVKIVRYDFCNLICRFSSSAWLPSISSTHIHMEWWARSAPGKWSLFYASSF